MGEKLRNELGKSNQAKDNANWEAKDYQRRLQASEALSQELQTRLSDTESRAHLAEKQFRDWQHQAHETWWSSMACHCLLLLLLLLPLDSYVCELLKRYQKTSR